MIDFSEFDNAYENISKNQVCLSSLHEKMTKENRKDPAFFWMVKMYNSEFDIPDNQKKKFFRAAITIINAAVFQKRIFFGLSFRLINNLILLDSNWKHKVKIHPREYSKFLQFCYKAKFFNKTSMGQKGSVTIYQILKKDVISLIPSNVKLQKEESLNFQLSGKKRKTDTEENKLTDAMLMGKIESSGIKSTGGHAVKQPDGSYMANLGTVSKDEESNDAD